MCTCVCVLYCILYNAGDCCRFDAAAAAVRTVDVTVAYVGVVADAVVVVTVAAVVFAQMACTVGVFVCALCIH